MRSAETQTELLECSSDEEEEEEQPVGSPSEGALEEDGGSPEVDRKEDDGEEEDEDDDDDSLDEESRLRTIKRLGCGNLFNFNKLELLNERSSGVADSSRNLCEHEVHVAIDDDLTTTTGEGKRTTMATMKTVLGGGDESVGSCSSVIFIQECPEVIL